MSGGDHFPDRYFPGDYFADRYFQGGEVAPGAMSASLVATSDLTGVLTAADFGVVADTHDLISFDPYLRRRQAKQARRKKDVEDLLSRLMGMTPEEAPPAVEKTVEAVKATVQRVLTLSEQPEYLITFEDLAIAAANVAKMERRLAAYRAELEEEDELMLMWA